MKDVTYIAACGRSVRVPASFSRHQAAHPVDRALLAEAIALVRIPGRGALVTDVDLGRTVGLSQRVAAPAVGPADEILAARRIGRPFPTRVVVDAEPEPTAHVALVVARDHLRQPVLVTAYIGRIGCPEPLGRLAAGRPGGLEESLSFWSRNALAWLPDVFVEEPFATTWERMLDGRWERDIPEAATVPWP